MKPRRGRLLLRFGFVRPGDELPPGSSVVYNPAVIAEIRAWYASDQPRPETRERWGPTDERTLLVTIPVGEGDA